MNRLPLQVQDSDYQLVLRCLAAPETFSLTGPEMRTCQALLKHFQDGRPLTHEDMAIAIRLLQAIRRRGGADVSEQR